MDEPKIVNVAERKLVASRMTMSLSDHQVRELWQGFRPRVHEIQNRVGSDFFSIQHFPENFKMSDFRPTTEFDKLAAVEVESQDHVPEGMEAYNLAGGRYAIFIHHGSASAFAKTFQHIYGVWIPQSEFELDSRDQFEILGPNYRPDDPNAEEEVWVPIK